MLTDAPPRDRHGAGFDQSDRNKTLDLPGNSVLPAIAKSIEEAMQTGKAANVRRSKMSDGAGNRQPYILPGLPALNHANIATGSAGSQPRMHSVYDVAYLNSCVLTYGQITEGCLKR